MTRLIGNWPDGQRRAAEMLNEFQTVWDDVGEDRFRRAVQDIIHSSELRFFPSIGEFRGYIPAPAGKTWWRNPTCPGCHGTGWTELLPQKLLPNGCWQDRTVKRCKREGCLHEAV